MIKESGHHSWSSQLLLFSSARKLSWTVTVTRSQLMCYCIQLMCFVIFKYIKVKFMLNKLEHFWSLFEDNYFAKQHFKQLVCSTLDLACFIWRFCLFSICVLFSKKPRGSWRSGHFGRLFGYLCTFIFGCEDSVVMGMWCWCSYYVTFMYIVNGFSRNSNLLRYCLSPWLINILCLDIIWKKIHVHSCTMLFIVSGFNCFHLKLIII